MPATYEPIATTTLGATATTITFSSIPATYTDLRLVFVFTTAASGQVRYRVNGDTGTNYSRTYLYGDGTTAASAQNANSSSFNLALAIASSTTIPQLAIIDFFSYAGNTFKTTLCDHAADSNGSGGTERLVSLWRSTAAINEIQIYNQTFNTGTTATLYGIKNA